MLIFSNQLCQGNALRRRWAASYPVSDLSACPTATEATPPQLPFQFYVSSSEAGKQAPPFKGQNWPTDLNWLFLNLCFRGSFTERSEQVIKNMSHLNLYIPDTFPPFIWYFESIQLNLTFFFLKLDGIKTRFEWLAADCEPLTYMLNGPLGTRESSLNVEAG